MMFGYGQNGGGGGFGGFNYRSSHQQGQDGAGGWENDNRGRGHRGRGRRRGGGGGPGGARRPEQQRRKKNLASFQAEIIIESSEVRGIIFGKGGTTLRWLREITGCRIFVPHAQHQQQRQMQRRNELVGSQSQHAVTPNLPSATHERNNEEHDFEQHPVRVNTFELSNFLHSFHEISCILLSQGNSHYLEDNAKSAAAMVTMTTPPTAAAASEISVPCVVKVRTNSEGKNRSNQPPSSTEITVNGQLYLRRGRSHNDGLLFRGTVLSSLSLTDHGPIGTPSLSSSTCRNNLTSNHPQIQQQEHLCAYSVQTTLNKEDITAIVDNVRFVNSSVTESCQWFYREALPITRDTIDHDDGDYNERISDSSRQGTERSDGTDNPINLEQKMLHNSFLVFGPDNGNPSLLCRAVREADAAYS
ncbi:hypothetical protein ACHAW5_003876 [Stephanodiscus triporus]|uniref:K Homology domain-containing protein n=1 Tax=Stephanodiscus triporus TaxID=2934178 RepID=A0ABD3MS11_9STRA